LEIVILRHIVKEAILVVSGKGVEMHVCVILAQGQTIVVDIQSSISIDDVMMKIRCLNRLRDCEHWEHSIGGTRLHYMTAGQTCEPFLFVEEFSGSSGVAAGYSRTLQLFCVFYAMGDYVVAVWHEWQFTPGEEASSFVSVAWLLFLFGMTARWCQHCIASERHGGQGLFVRPCARRTAGEEDVPTYSDHQVNQHVHERFSSPHL
jgi:hypothetical protein